MSPVTGCRFCQIANGHFGFEIDRPYLESEKFIALPTIGALVEGWSLVVPKQHAFSMRSHFGDRDFELFTSEVMTVLTERYGKVVAFEHGANQAGSSTGCGTDHAHLHLVPLKQTLLQDMLSSGLTWQDMKAQEVERAAAGREYLFYSDMVQNSWVNPESKVHVLKKPVSQFFRKLIASREGLSDYYDYNKFPRLETAAKTQKAVRSVSELQLAR